MRHVYSLVLRRNFRIHIDRTPKIFLASPRVSTTAVAIITSSWPMAMAEKVRVSYMILTTDPLSMMTRCRPYHTIRVVIDPCRQSTV